MFEPVVSSFVNSCEGLENFQGGMPMKTLLVFVLNLLIVMLILSLVGKLLWNNVLVKLVPGVKPATSVFQILGLYLLSQFLFN